MNIACFSDTHTKHGEWYNQLPDEIKLKFDEADMLIHTGDFTEIGDYVSVDAFLTWFSKRPNKHKVLIAGNHDFYFDTDDTPKNRYNFPTTDLDVQDMLEKYPNIVYLNNAEVIIDGFKIWGSPTNKWFHDWAFNRHEGDDIKRYWDLIPEDTDILMTHGPAYGILDLCPQGDKLVHLGDKDLLEAVQRVKPKLFCFGHIHEGYGLVTIDEDECEHTGIAVDNIGTIFVNATCMNEIYKPKNPPIFVELEKL